MLVSLLVISLLWWASLYSINRFSGVMWEFLNAGANAGYAVFLARFCLDSPDFALPWWGVVTGLGGVVILSFLVWRDARALGESVYLPLIRSFDGAFFTALVFGAQVYIFIHLSDTITPYSIALLYGVVATATALQVFSGRIQAGFDQFAFLHLPAPRKRQLTQARADLREAADALPKTPTIDLGTLDEAEFAKLTRRALSSFGDLPRLSTSPLLYLPVIEARIAARGGRDDMLDRAVELKRLLAEQIARLRPDGDDSFGTSAEWRHYNVLYFPYVAGLRPYAVPGNGNHAAIEGDPLQEQVLDWFQAEVPERTLHNWQNAAARLIAAQLR